MSVFTLVRRIVDLLPLALLQLLLIRVLRLQHDSLNTVQFRSETLSSYSSASQPGGREMFRDNAIITPIHEF